MTDTRRPPNDPAKMPREELEQRYVEIWQLLDSVITHRVAIWELLKLRGEHIRNHDVALEAAIIRYDEKMENAKSDLAL